MAQQGHLNIPTLDLNHWDQSSDEALVESLAEFGLVHIKGHEISADLLERFYLNFRDVLSRPVDEKSTWGGQPVWFQRGWTPPDTERAVVAGGQPDFKECFFAAPIPTDAKCRVEHPEVYAENIWPENSVDFRLSYLRMGARLHEVGVQLLQAISRGLGLDESALSQAVEGGPHVTRALKYLSLNDEQINAGVLWGEEHTDFNMLTLLPGGQFYDGLDTPVASPDPSAGLYLRTRSGERVRGSAPSGALVVQVGQQLEILTGGRLLATPHVVTAPKALGYTRCACAHFVHLHAHQMVRPLEAFATEAAVRAYSPPVLAGTYALKTLVDIGLAPKSAIESLGYRHYDRLVQQRADDSP
ncbi:MAG: isopenicillin N synthase family dioxygenase [Bradymonadia bacterium]